MNDEANLSRARMRTMAEDAMRSGLAIAAGGDREGAIAALQRYYEQIDAVAELMPLGHAEQFRLLGRKEIAMLDEEIGRDRDGALRRLGVTPPRSAASRQGVVEMAACTVVRATIWEAIFTLFRSFR